MSRQSKNAKRKILAQQITKQRLAGNKGPAQTVAKHGKKRENCLWFKRKLAAAVSKKSYLEEIQNTDN